MTAAIIGDLHAQFDIYPVLVAMLDGICLGPGEKKQMQRQLGGSTVNGCGGIATDEVDGPKWQGRVASSEGMRRK
jgi:hypothetical protein